MAPTRTSSHAHAYIVPFMLALALLAFVLHSEYEAGVAHEHEGEAWINALGAQPLAAANAAVVVAPARVLRKPQAPPRRHRHGGAVGTPGWRYGFIQPRGGLGTRMVAGPNDHRAQFCPLSAHQAALANTNALRQEHLKAFEQTKRARCAIVTAIFGDYEKRVQPGVRKGDDTVPCDKYVFTNRASLKHDGSWTVVTTPYHLNNTVEGVHHTRPGAPWFNVAKYYKMQFYKVPLLANYDVIVWQDGHGKLTAKNANELLVNHALKYGIACVKHDRNHYIVEEMLETRKFVGGKYPINNMYRSYARFLEEGFCEQWWQGEQRAEKSDTWELPCGKYADTAKLNALFCDTRNKQVPRLDYQECASISATEEGVRAAAQTRKEAIDALKRMTKPRRPLPDGVCRGRPDRAAPEMAGGFTTSLVTYHVADPRVRQFLDVWFEENMRSTVQDQLIFPYAIWRTGFMVHQWPDGEYNGNQRESNIHFKGMHGV